MKGFSFILRLIDIQVHLSRASGDDGRHDDVAGAVAHAQEHAHQRRDPHDEADRLRGNLELLEQYGQADHTCAGNAGHPHGKDDDRDPQDDQAARGRLHAVDICQGQGKDSQLYAGAVHIQRGAQGDGQTADPAADPQLLLTRFF